MRNKAANISIGRRSTIIEALRKMDNENVRLLLVEEDLMLEGVISIGDIQRAIIANKPLSAEIGEIMRDSISVALEGDDMEEVKRKMLLRKIEIMPVINDRREIVDVLYWNDLFDEAPGSLIYEKTDVPVVIMAGGRGERMRPLTNVIPKALIPVGDNPIIEEIINRFRSSGCRTFYVSVNYMSEVIKDYFRRKHSEHAVEFIEEDKPLGTAGSLSYLKGKVSTPFFVSNCDVLIDQNYGEILKYHRDSANEITVVVSVRSAKVPYGIVETGDNGSVTGLTEKPYISYKVNTGLYVLEPSVLDDIDTGDRVDLTSLIDRVLKRGGRVGAFPVSEKSWFDIGELGAYWQFVNQALSKQKGHA